MADDGLLMNFSIEDGIARSKPVFRGGCWKDRLTAKRKAEYRRKKLQAPGPHTQTSPILPAKATEKLSPEHSTTARLSKRQKVADTAITRSKSSREIVSSLFSSNPTSKLPPKSPSPDITPSAPSNAPLLNSLHTFTSLGLSPQIATHLLTKLSLRSPTAIQKSAISQLLSDDSDAFLQAETGSGKTLAYLLPIVQRIMCLFSQTPNTAIASDVTSPLPAESRQRQFHRSSGLFAIILAPTRELCKQISTVLEHLLRCVHWIVAGTVTGGEKRKSEKARLRKGINILVATPGRLADHLENTEVLDVSRVRWLVLDEGDRLMELGFEEEIKGIVKKLEEQKARAGKTTSGGGMMPSLQERRTTVMCSATMKMTVQRLGEISLKDAVHIKVETEIPSGEQPTGETKDTEEFSAPTQLKQFYAIVPAKQRLVTLAALLKRTFARRGSVMKAIVFLSCADSVDFHFEVFARDTPVSDPHTGDQPLRDIFDGTEKGSQMTPQPPQSPLPTVSQTPTLTNSLNPQLTIHKLHGSLAQSLRTATLSAFARSQHPCILLCTDVASRGLDLPKIDLVIEYDPPFSSDDHLHRVGRTARAGREGSAVIFLMPDGEEGYVDILKKGDRNGTGKGLVKHEAKEILKKGFESEVAGVSAKVSEESVERNWEERATEWQLEVERWVIEDRLAREMAQRAFMSHIRAYATHVAREREMFNVKELHLGHLAKAFALRDRPGGLGRRSTMNGQGPRRSQATEKTMMSHNGESRDKEESRLANSALQVQLRDSQDAERRMRAKMKEHMTVAGEFNIG
ncbi:ATP-dependent RNA helicase dbp7 [Sticta canariensis]|nr:ATP-dependent RNA helicase dbp7 [Sticta canariensis]